MQGRHHGGVLRRLISMLIIEIAVACGALPPGPTSSAVGGSAVPSSSVASAPQLLRVAFANGDLGVVAGRGVIERTTDGGTRWLSAYRGPATIWSLQWLDLGHVFAASDLGLLASDDGGSTWRSSGEQRVLLQVRMLTEASGFAITGTVREGSGWLPLNVAIAGRELMRTTDGGLHWSTVSTGLSIVQTVSFMNTTVGWVAGPEGIAVSRDAGASWTWQLRLPPETYATAAGVTWGGQLAMFDAQHGFALYRSVDTSLSKSGRDVYYTEDGGAQWRLQSATVRRSWAPTAATNSGGGADGPLVVTGELSAEQVSGNVAAPETYLLASADAGRTWTARTIPFAGTGVGDLAVSGQTRWVALTDGSLAVGGARRTAILRSDDAGVSWRILR